MSYTVNLRQSHVSYKNAMDYKPVDYSVEGIRITRVPIKCGHPLYTEVADVFYAEVMTDEVCMMPIVPDGCNTVVVRSIDDEVSAFVCGSINEIRKIEVHPGEIVYFVKFLPGIGHSLLNSTKEKMTNNVKKLSDCIRGFEQIEFAIRHELPPVKVVEIIGTVINNVLSKENHVYLIKFCTEKIIKNLGNISVSALAEESGFTERHISKMFDVYVGLSPKSFSQIIRLQNTMKVISGRCDQPLVDVAVAYGFFDHAHMNRTYNKFIHRSAGDFGHSCFSGLNYDDIDEYVDEIH